MICHWRVVTLDIFLGRLVAAYCLLVVSFDKLCAPKLFLN